MKSTTSSAKKRVVEGVKPGDRATENRLKVDVRTFGQKIEDAIVDPTMVSIGIVVCTLIVAFGVPALSHVMPILILLVVWWHILVREVRLPFRMPIGANCIDLGNPKPGMTGSYEKSLGLILIGYDFDRGDAQIWAARNDFLGHTLILGKTGAGKTEGILSLFANSFSYGSGGIFIDGKGDPKAVFQMYELAYRMGVVEDFLLLDYMTGGQAQGGRQRTRMSNTCNPFATASADSCFQIMSSMVKTGDGGSNNVFSDRAMSLMSAVLEALAVLRDAGAAVLSPQTIRDGLPLPALKAMRDHPKMSAQMAGLVHSGYFMMLPGYKDTYTPQEAKSEADMLTQHGYGVSYFARSLGSFIGTYGHIFNVSQGEIDFTDICFNNRILMCALPPLEKSPAEIKTLGTINLALVKEVFARSLGTGIEGSFTEIIDNRPSSSNVPFLMVFDEVAYILSDGIGVIPAQARGLGFAVVFAGQDWGSIEGSEKIASQQIWGSTTLKIVGVVEDPETISRFITKFGKVSVVQTTSFEVEGSPTAQISGAGFREVDLVSSIDLQSQTEGMAHMSAFGQLYRMAFFFAAPSGKGMKMTVNRLLSVGDIEARYHLATGEPRLDVLLVSGVGQTPGGTWVEPEMQQVIEILAQQYSDGNSSAAVDVPTAPLQSFNGFFGDDDAANTSEFDESFLENEDKSEGEGDEVEDAEDEGDGSDGYADDAPTGQRNDLTEGPTENAPTENVSFGEIERQFKPKTIAMGVDVIADVQRQLLTMPTIDSEALSVEEIEGINASADALIEFFSS